MFNNKKAIRGGIPVVFREFIPVILNCKYHFAFLIIIIACFGPWELGPQHGFARISKWNCSKPPTKVRISTGLCRFKDNAESPVLLLDTCTV